MSDDLIPTPNSAQKLILYNPDANDSDVEYARDNIRNILDEGNKALLDMASIAQQSQHPKAYEALSGLMSTLLKGNRDLVEIQKIRKELEEKTPSDTGNNHVTNNLFIGSTAQLTKLIEDLKNK